MLQRRILTDESNETLVIHTTLKISCIMLFLLNREKESEANERNRKTSLGVGGQQYLFSPTLRYDGEQQSDTKKLQQYGSIHYTSEVVEEHAPSLSTVNNQNQNISMVTPNVNNNNNNNINSSSSKDSSSKEDEDIEEDFNPYLFISSLPPHGNVMVQGKICLPMKSSSNRITLALDLDETLVHCTVEPIAKPDLVFPVTFNGIFYQVFVRKRPFLDFFLETVSKSFEVGLIYSTF